MYHRMGRRKFRLGRIPKSYEKNPKRKRRPAGRPKKFIQPASSDLSSSYPLSTTCPPSPTHSSSPNEVCLKTLTKDLVLPSEQWVIQTQNADSVGICKTSCSPQDAMVVTHSLVVTHDLSWTLTVHGKEVDPQMCSALSGTPKTLSTAKLQAFLSVVDKATVCPGHPDQQFLFMLHANKGKLLSRDGHTVAYIDSHSPVNLNGEGYPKTVRYSSCELLVKERNVHHVYATATLYGKVIDC